MVLSAKFKEKLSSFGLDDSSTIHVLGTLQIEDLEDLSCFTEDDFVEGGMKLFKARKLMHIYEMSQGNTELTQRQKSGDSTGARDYRHSMSYEHRSDSFKKKLQQQKAQQQGKDASPPRQPFLGRSSSNIGGDQNQRLVRLSSQVPTKTSTAQANFSSEALLQKRANSVYDPRKASALQPEEPKKTGRASISQHPLLRQQLETAERQEQEQLLKDQAERRRQQRKLERMSSNGLSPKDVYIQKQKQRQSIQNGPRGNEFHGQEHIVYEYHNYSSLHPNDRPPIPSNQRRLPNRGSSYQRGVSAGGSSLDGPDADELLNFVEDREILLGGRNARGSMESVMMDQSPPLPPQQQLDVHEADYCFEEATKAFSHQQFDRSMLLCQKASEIYKQIWKQTPQGKFPPEQAHTCFTLYTELLRRCNRFEEAERNCKSLVKLEKKFCGVDHLMTADALFMMGKMQLEMQKLDHAAYSIGESLRVQIKHEKDHIRTASGFYYLGLVFQVQERYEKSLPCFSEAVRIFTKCVGAQHSDTAEALHGMSTVLYKQGNLEKARETFFKTLTTKIMVYGKDHVSTADTLLNASMVLRDQGNLKEAFKYATRSYEVLGKVYGGEHERTQEAGDHIDHLHDLLDHAKNTVISEEEGKPESSDEPNTPDEPRLLSARGERNSIQL